MKKLITWQGDILKKFKFFLIILYFIIQPTLTSASERWILDTSLSTVDFELPVLFAKNVKGKFNSIEGFVELDVTEKDNNKAIFSVQISDIDMNYIKYKDLLLSSIFFDAENFPKAVVDTKKFSYVNEKELELKIELSIKGKNEIVPLKIYITRLAEELVQIQSELVFSRTAYDIGIGNWRNTSILKDNVKLKANLFLFREQI
ncbi:YceI family protein [Alphaproteobacteria bacterium]|nr:YceI family protein [Alphaproteobacteria bacterium]